ncbi:MAG: thioredoxin family protein [Chitinophagaceae bacterium]|nr:thioredoxin family protein [Chitinophagaceae bacterium]
MKLTLTTIFIALHFFASAHISDTLKPYNPNANAKADIEQALQQAKQQNKHVLLMIGGNWCSWCIKFNKFVLKDAQLDSALHANYILYHLNHSKENENKELLTKYEFPQRFGFPVFVILNAEGKRIHTQNSAYLEEAKGYSKRNILEFFDHWSPRALKLESYQE